MLPIPVIKTNISGIIISTVMLEHDHLYVYPYETMIFEDGEAILDDWQKRAQTHAEAVAHHIEAIYAVLRRDNGL